MLMGDDDNALTVAKGRVANMTSTGADDAGVASYDIHYNIAAGTVSGFQRVTTAGEYTGLTSFTSANGSGEAYFRLGIKE